MIRISSSQSLKVRLTTRLILGLVALALVASVAAYAVSTAFANRAYDRSLFDDVHVLANQVRWKSGGADVSLSPEALIWLLADEGDEVIFRVTDVRMNRTLASNGNLGPLPEWVTIRPDAPYFRNVRVGSEEMRVAYVRKHEGDGEALVEIGETLGKRQLVARNILVGTISLMSGFIVVAVILVWTGVGTGLQPLERLEAEAARRSIGFMEPLDRQAAPREVHGLIDAVNRMIERVGSAATAQRNFIANAAHQLRTPIAGLRLQAQLALRSHDWSDARRSIEAVERSADQSAHLIEQLLVLARVDTQGGANEEVTLDLVAIVTGALERHLSVATARSVDLAFQGDGTRPVVRGNETLFTEMFSNVIDNALRYGVENGHVTIAVTSDANGADVVISDDGPGLDSERGAEAFTRFSRGDTQRGDGSGLGLAIVKEIADRYHVAVTARSRPMFDGTAVAFHLSTCSASIQLAPLA